MKIYWLFITSIFLFSLWRVYLEREFCRQLSLKERFELNGIYIPYNPKIKNGNFILQKSCLTLKIPNDLLKKEYENTVIGAFGKLTTGVTGDYFYKFNLKISKITSLNDRDVFFLDGLINPIYFSIQDKIDDLKESLRSHFQKVFNPKNTSIVMGMLLGDNTDLEKEDQDTFRKSGLIHLMVASGGNILFIAGFLDFILKRFTQYKMRLFIVLFFIWFYVVLSGINPPIVRAAIMVSCYFLARMLGRKISGLLVILHTILFLLILQPNLYQSLSFYLSIAATLGVVLYTESLENLTETLLGNLPLGVKVLLSNFFSGLCISCLISPLLLYSFGEINILSVFATLLVAPIVSPILLSSLFVVGISYFSLSLAVFVGWLVEPFFIFLHYFNTLFSHTLYFPLKLSLQFWQLALWYLCCFTFFILVNKKMKSQF